MNPNLQAILWFLVFIWILCVGLDAWLTKKDISTWIMFPTFTAATLTVFVGLGWMILHH